MVWSFFHAVNSRSRLADFLQSGADVAEGDVLADGRGAPIMAHPPDRTSDLTFAAWVDAAAQSGHAIKVDLKEPEVVDPVLEILASRRFDAARVVVNADTVQGPGGTRPRLSPTDLARFRDALGPVTLSIGATTAAGGRYRPEHIAALRADLEAVGEPATVALRADLVLADPGVLSAFEHTRVSIWNHPGTFAADDAAADRFRAMLPDAWIDLIDSEGKPVFGSAQMRQGRSIAGR